MGMQAGHASRKKAGPHAGPIVPSQHVGNVTNHVEIGNENVLADKTVVPSDILSCVWMNIVCGFFENHADVGSALVL